MKAYVAAVLFLTVVAVYGGPTVDLDENSLDNPDPHVKWFTFKALHGKEYASHEEGNRKALFLERTREIEEHNARFHQGLESFKMAHNKMSDLTVEEVRQMRMGVERSSNADEIMANVSVRVTPVGYNPPWRYDWREYNGVSPVKDQGNCSNCYIFAVASALESAHWRRWGVLPDISEQDIMDCSMRYGNRGCVGGWLTTTLKWLKDNDGYIDEKDDPYEEKVQQCFHERKCKIAKISDYGIVRPRDETALAYVVATEGPVAVSFNGTSRAFIHYETGILDVPDCGTIRNHAGLIVGYGTENRTDYWIVKNSWADDWGENGYFRIKRGVNMCGIADQAISVHVF